MGLDKKNIIKSFWNKTPCGTRNILANEGTKEFFDEIERKRYELEPFIHKYAQFKEWEGKRVLEIGCGAGTDFIQFCRVGADICAVDFSISSISLTHKRLEILSFNRKKVCVGDAENLPFPDSYFDFVYSWGVLHHSPNTEKAISEIHRVLRPSGKICIMLYHKYSLVAIQLYLLYGIFTIKPFSSIDEIIANHLESIGTKAYTKAQVRTLFQDYSDLLIETIVTKYDLRYWRNKSKSDKFLPAWVSKLIPDSLGWYIVIKGEK